MSTTIRCKFVCVSVTKQKHWDGAKGFLYTAKFTPVIDGSEENKRFYAFTPSGSLEIGTYKEDHFEVGAQYYLDISPSVSPASDG